MPKISVIMPSLNVGNYIEECMESVINQTFKDLEIIIIDAGSTDGTLEILQKYVNKDWRIKLIHSEKKSYGYQMNLGIQYASGEYIGIVETDDIIETDMYESLYKEIVSNDYDYVKGNAQTFIKISKDIEVNTDIKCLPDQRVALNPSENPKLFVTDRFLWLGLYKADFIKKIRLNETPGAAYQDIGFIFHVLNESSKALYIDKIVYHYRQDNMKASGYNKKAFKYLLDEYKILLDSNLSEKWIPSVYTKMVQQCLGRFHNMALSGEYWSEYSKEIETLRFWILSAQKKGLLSETMLGITNWKLLEIWQNGSYNLYKHCVDKYYKKNSTIKDCFGKIGKNKVVIFGAGKYGQFFHALCEKKYPKKVVAYCDNNSALSGSWLQGVRILDPKCAVQTYLEAVFVITVYKDVENVRNQLLMMGVSAERIIRYEPNCDSKMLNMEY